MSARGKIPDYWEKNVPHYKHYKYIGGIDDYDIWALSMPRTKVKGAWDCLIFNVRPITLSGDYVDAGARLDIYMSNDPGLRIIQSKAFEGVGYNFGPERIATLGAMILCFAPYLITSSVRPEFKHLHDLLGDTLTNA